MFRLTGDRYEVSARCWRCSGATCGSPISRSSSGALRGGDRLRLARAAGAVRQLAHDRHAARGGGRRRVSWSGVFQAVQEQRRFAVASECGGLDSAGVKVQGDGTGARTEAARRPSASRAAAGIPRFHRVAANDRIGSDRRPVARRGPRRPEGRKLLGGWQRCLGPVPMAMDRAYEGDGTRQLARQLGFEPVEPLNPNRCDRWTYDRGLYRGRNEIERLFRRLKGFRRILSRFEKLDQHVHRLHLLRADHRHDSC